MTHRGDFRLSQNLRPQSCIGVNSAGHGVREAEGASGSGGDAGEGPENGRSRDLLGAEDAAVAKEY